MLSGPWLQLCVDGRLPGGDCGAPAFQVHCLMEDRLEAIILASMSAIHPMKGLDQLEAAVHLS